MSGSKNTFERLAADDLVRVDGPGRPSFVCLVVSVNGRTIRARHLMGDEHFDFDRATGITQSRAGEAYTISSIEPLPVEIYHALLGLNRKMRLTLDRERLKLNAAEIAALLFLGDHYDKHPVQRDAEARPVP
jgi:hypothetical protein